MENFPSKYKEIISHVTEQTTNIIPHLNYSRWTSSLPSCLWSLRIFPSLPGSRLTIFYQRCKLSTLTTRQPMVEFYLLTLSRFPLRKKEHKSYFGKNRTRDFCTSRCAGYLLDHSGDTTVVILINGHCLVLWTHDNINLAPTDLSSSRTINSSEG